MKVGILSSSTSCHALNSPKGITNHSYKPLWVLKIIFYSSPGWIQIWWYPLFKSIFKNIFDPPNLSSISYSRGIKNWYFTMILLIALLSTYILQLSFFFGVSKSKTTHGLILSHIKPLQSNSFTCSYKISYSFMFIRYWGKLGRLAPRIRLIWC